MCGEPLITLVIIRLRQIVCKEDGFAFTEFIIHVYAHWGMFLIGTGARLE
jgi:hypothetical protein